MCVIHILQGLQGLLPLKGPQRILDCRDEMQSVVPDTLGTLESAAHARPSPLESGRCSIFKKKPLAAELMKSSSNTGSAVHGELLFKP